MTLVIVVLVLAGCSKSPDLATISVTTTSTTDSGGLTAPPGSSLVATAQGRELTVREVAGGQPMQRLGNHSASGGPLTLLVVGSKPGWLQVSLPGRPNGRSGWVKEADVQVAATPWRLVISESAHTLDVFESGKPVEQYPVGVGRSATPTVRGTFFVTELIRPPNPDGAYGPYAFGLSAYSDVLTSFAGGDGELGLHGTNQPQLVGTNVSHGCLRVTNDVITELAHKIPLGTPVEIHA